MSYCTGCYKHDSCNLLKGVKEEGITFCEHRIRAVDVWTKHFDPYMQDIAGFEHFLRYWEQCKDTPNLDWPDFVLPCILCAKRDKTCHRNNVYRVGGEKVKFHFAAPKSHLWRPLKRPRKDTCCLWRL